MMPDAYLNLIRKTIAAQCPTIKGVADLRIIATAAFDDSSRAEAIKLIKERDWEGASNLTPKIKFPWEYFHVVHFKDNSGQAHELFLYDNDDLWQNPLVIDME